MPVPLSYCKFTATVKIIRLKKSTRSYHTSIFIPQQKKWGCGGELFHMQKGRTVVKSFSGLWHFKVKNSDNPAQPKGQDLCQESTSISGSVTGGLCDLQQRATPLLLQPLLVHRERTAFCYGPK